MKCLKCGSEYTDGTKTCPICGNNSIVAEDNNNQINGNHESMNIKEPSRVQSYQNMSGVYQQYNPPMIPRQKKPVNKKLIGIIAGVAIILIATIIIVVIISKLPKTVKLDGYVKIEVEDGILELVEPYTYTAVVFSGSGTEEDPYVPAFAADTFYKVEGNNYVVVSSQPDDWGTGTYYTRKENKLPTNDKQGE